MSDNLSEAVVLPDIPGKRYFTIGEVSELCDVKTHVLRYWEQEFTQLRPVKRRGNRRYYQRQDVLLIRQIRDLLYHQGYTIQGARQQLQEQRQQARAEAEPLPVAAVPSLGSQTPDTVWHLALGEMIDDLEQIAQMLSHER
ncbi:MerR family transcriptional regulator [Amnimonas aquatica]|uniref:MerR family transcriptional regulator n=1 Tax=Amnimonas aquatica TaxID=2094561 RepID=A0A2P6AQU9_9GAMM|nr:MerR family transcriptional regulator [Amnimonas aquatica]